MRFILQSYTFPLKHPSFTVPYIAIFISIVLLLQQFRQFAFQLFYAGIDCKNRTVAVDKEHTAGSIRRPVAGPYHIAVIDFGERRPEISVYLYGGPQRLVIFYFAGKTDDSQTFGRIFLVKRNHFFGIASAWTAPRRPEVDYRHFSADEVADWPHFPVFIKSLDIDILGSDCGALT